jgi:tetratricopeptide (TPR) repeat protein
LGLDDWVTHWYHGLALRSLETYDEAVQAFEQALAKSDSSDPGLTASLSGDLAEALRLWGDLLDLPSLLERAVEAFDRVLQTAPDLSDLFWLYDAKGRALLALKRYEEALVAFAQVPQGDANAAWAQIGQGKAHYFLQQLQPAYQAFERVLTLDVDHSSYDLWAHGGRGVVLEQMGDLDGALEAYARALRALGDAPAEQAFADRAAMFEGFGAPYAIARAEEDHKMALALTARAYEAGKNDPRKAPELASELAVAHNALAWLYVDKLPTPDNLAQALALADRAVELEGSGPNKGNYADTRGWVYYALGRYSDAVVDLKEAVDLAAYDILIRRHLELAELALQQAASSTGES